MSRGARLWDAEACYDIADGRLAFKQEQEDAHTGHVGKSLGALYECLHSIYLLWMICL